MKQFKSTQIAVIARWVFPLCMLLQSSFCLAQFIDREKFKDSIIGCDPNLPINSQTNPTCRKDILALGMKEPLFAARSCYMNLFKNNVDKYGLVIHKESEYQDSQRCINAFFRLMLADGRKVPFCAYIEVAGSMNMARFTELIKAAGYFNPLYEKRKNYPKHWMTYTHTFGESIRFTWRQYIDNDYGGGTIVGGTLTFYSNDYFSNISIVGQPISEIQKIFSEKPIKRKDEYHTNCFELGRIIVKIDPLSQISSVTHILPKE